MKDDQISGTSWGDGVESSDFMTTMKAEVILGSNSNDARTIWNTTEKTQFKPAAVVESPCKLYAEYKDETQLLADLDYRYIGWRI